MTQKLSFVNKVFVSHQTYLHVRCRFAGS